MVTDQTDSGLDLVWGVDAIGKVIGRSARQAQYLLTTGQIPGRRIGERWVVERSKLVAFFKGEAA